MNLGIFWLDGYISCAVNIVKQAELDYLEQQTAELYEFEPSIKYCKKENKLFKKANIKESWRTQYKPLKRIAACVIVGLAIITCAFAPVQAVQRAVIDTVIEWYDVFTTFIYNNSNTKANVIPSELKIGYVPSEYKYVLVDEKSEYKLSYIVKSSNDRQLRILINAVENNYVLSTDNEQYKFYPIKFNEKDAFLGVSAVGESVLIWHDQNMLFNVSATINVDELIKIAENIKY